MIRKYIILLSAAALLVQSCKDDSFGPTVKAGAAPAIVAPAAGASIVLKEADAANAFPSFLWTSADFGYEAGTTYKLEMDVTSDNFANPTVIGTVNALSITGKTVGDMDAILLAMGLKGGQETSVDLRVTATVSTKVPALVSAVSSFKVTPYEKFIPITVLQVPGDYQNPTWNPADTTTEIYCLKADKKYEGYLYFPNATTQFKYTDGPSWTTNYGDNAGNGTLAAGGSNISATGAGMYKLNVNLNTLTHTLLLTNWSVIGDATAGGWSTDSDLTYNPANKALEITADLVAGSIKFRANHDWAVNLGDDGNDKVLDYGGANIAVASAGNYTIRLFLSAPHYTYTITKN
jgi:hypothetical protein